jgi:hypothetical protein
MHALLRRPEAATEYRHDHDENEGGQLR